MVYKTKEKSELTAGGHVPPVRVSASTEFKMVPKLELTAVEPVRHVLLVSTVFRMAGKPVLTVADLAHLYVVQMPRL